MSIFCGESRIVFGKLGIHARSLNMNVFRNANKKVCSFEKTRLYNTLLISLLLYCETLLFFQ